MISRVTACPRWRSSGRSNVGKSSLINALVRRRWRARARRPGKTRLANFYRVKRGAAPALFLVDLPGYGYARGGDAVGARSSTGWRTRISRAGPAASDESRIRCVLLLVDSRHPGLESDLEAWEWLRVAAVPRAVSSEPRWTS